MSRETPTIPWIMPFRSSIIDPEKIAGIRALSYADPLTYGVDGLRAVLIGWSSLPVLVDLAVMIGFARIMLFLGGYFFEKSEGV
jgi:ABC-2 type transport system permease protein